jgi:hypothetical protein
MQAQVVDGAFCAVSFCQMVNLKHGEFPLR